ncbi:MAG: response regulator [Actinobacteria bacterium]|nr:response regulator [Actinomycetota bacterium]MSX26005.1 response regulator [Actinomycetota bacterium]MSY05664.1 response regulator [Actinomycetota bacterium]MSY67933.1 response regulator [Actinomycetota bacterium]MSZ59556.1 response regulator [Actinomycetota bacterium]
MDLIEMLREAGYNVIGEAANGREAISLARHLKPDLAILDVKMPEIDGISAAEVIVSEKLAAVLMLTAFSQRELVERARDAGAMAYLVKPFSISDLTPAIEMALGRYAQIQALEAEVGDLGQRLEARKLVDRAKGVLMANLGISEPEAFKWIQKAAMDQRSSMSAVSEGVLAHYQPGS